MEETENGIQRTMEALFSTKTITRFGTWKVRTLYQSGRLAQLLKEFDDYRLYILGMSEMKWIESGRIISDGKTILNSCHEDRHEHGVGLVLSKEAVRALIGWKPVNDCIITACFGLVHTKTTIVQVFAPMDNTEVAFKDNFYNQLQDVVNDIPNHDLKMQDFNAQLGGDRLGLETVVGPHASSTHLSDNGERLVSFCEHNGLSIGNTYFQHREIHKKTWRSPDGRIFNEIDLICISQKWRSN